MVRQAVFARFAEPARFCSLSVPPPSCALPSLLFSSWLGLILGRPLWPLRSAIRSFKRSSSSRWTSLRALTSASWFACSCSCCSYCRHRSASCCSLGVSTASACSFLPATLPHPQQFPVKDLEVGGGA